MIAARLHTKQGLGATRVAVHDHRIAPSFNEVSGTLGPEQPRTGEALLHARRPEVYRARQSEPATEGVRLQSKGEYFVTCGSEATATCCLLVLVFRRTRS